MFEASIANITDLFPTGEIFENEFLQLHGVSIMEEEIFLQLHTGVSARFKRANLRKTSTLKTYQR